MGADVLAALLACELNNSFRPPRLAASEEEPWLKNHQQNFADVGYNFVFVVVRRAEGLGCGLGEWKMVELHCVCAGVCK